MTIIRFMILSVQLLHTAQFAFRKKTCHAYCLLSFSNTKLTTLKYNTRVLIRTTYASTCGVVTTILQPLQAIDQRLQYVLPLSGQQKVQVGKNTCGKRKSSFHYTRIITHGVLKLYCSVSNLYISV